MHIFRRICLAVMIVVVNGAALCEPPPIVCTASIDPGLTVRVTDARTGEGVMGATVTATDGDYVEVLDPPGSSSGSHVGAYERPGTYTLTIEAQGYVSQTIEDVVVERGVCHVHMVWRTVELTPAS